MAALNQCIFRKNQVVCSLAGPKLLVFGSHSSANFQPILYCFVPNFKLKCEDSENIKADRVDKIQSFSIYVKSNVGRFLEHPAKYIHRLMS